MAGDSMAPVYDWQMLPAAERVEVVADRVDHALPLRTPAEVTPWRQGWRR